MLTIEQLKFARKHGLKWWNERGFAYKVAEGGIIMATSIGDMDENWFPRTDQNLDGVVEIDFSRLDDYSADKEFDIKATGGEVDADTANEHSKYHREVKPGVFVDVYDVIKAWCVTNPAQQHLIKKALQAGGRGHKDYDEDMDDVIASAKRAKELQND